MNYCDNIIVLYIFLFIKILIVFIFPILIFKYRKKADLKIFMIIEIVLLLLLFILNYFNINSCIYNSNFDGIKRITTKNKISKYNELHNTNDYYENIDEVEPDNYYKTYLGKKFYYYNQNNKIIGTKKLSCSIYENSYMNKYGSSITSIASVLSTLYDRNISPIEVMNLYLDEGTTNCSTGVNIVDVFNIVKDKYAGLEISEISSSEVLNSIYNGGLIIAEIAPKEGSNLTCNNSYIVIYSVNLDGKYIISDSNDYNTEYVCSNSSLAYGSVLKSNRTGSEWDSDIINSQTLHYYLIKRV